MSVSSKAWVYILWLIGDIQYSLLFSLFFLSAEFVCFHFIHVHSYTAYTPLPPLPLVVYLHAFIFVHCTWIIFDTVLLFLLSTCILFLFGVLFYSFLSFHPYSFHTLSTNDECVDPGAWWIPRRLKRLKLVSPISQPVHVTTTFVLIFIFLFNFYQLSLTNTLDGFLS